jgi:hypothetical protein
MSKIICSLEDWDSILNYYRPNGSSKTWYIKELKQLRIPLMWGDWNVLTEDGEMFSDGHLRNQITPNHSNLIQYTPKENINGSKHIYIINVYTNQFFYSNKEIGFKCISKEFLDDIRKGNSKILMFFLYEGYSGMENNQDFEVIEKWRIDAGLPEYSVYYVCGNLLSEKIVENKNLKFKAKGIHYFEPWNKYNGDIVTFKPHTDKYLFLSYNRQYRHHRVRFIIDLIENNLIDKGLVSLNKIEHDLPYETTDEIKDFFKNTAPLMIDTMPELKYNLAINITVEDYERTFISVVTETMVDKDTLFFSEKIWKPIMVGHPFMVYGNKGSLSYLKSLGFRSYDKWIDESYDEEPDRDLRCKMIVNQLNKFNSLPISKLIEIREEMKDTCIYNYAHYKTYYREKYGDNDQSKTIRDVLLEMWSDLSEIKPERNVI